MTSRRLISSTSLPKRKAAKADNNPDRARNQAYGKAFENRLRHQAARLGLWLLPNGSQVKFLPGGRTIAVRSDLDFRLIGPGGAQCCFDSKSVAGDYFVYSFLTTHQLIRALEYTRWGVKAGFVVHFRQSGTVSFFCAQAIKASGPRTRFTPTDGLVLGPETGFALNVLLA